MKMATNTPDEQPRLAERGPIATLFGGPARTQIIEAFVANKSRELTVSDISRLSDTARSTVYRHLDELEELGVITAVDAGPNNRYTLNDDSEIATRLWELEGLTLQRLLDIEDSDE